MIDFPNSDATTPAQDLMDNTALTDAAAAPPPLDFDERPLDDAFDLDSDVTLSLLADDDQNLARFGYRLLHFRELEKEKEERDRQNLIMDFALAAHGDINAKRRLVDRGIYGLGYNIVTPEEREGAGYRVRSVMGDPLLSQLIGEDARVLEDDVLWDKFCKATKPFVDARQKQIANYEKNVSHLSELAEKYVDGGSLNAQDRIDLEKSGVDIDSLTRARRAVSYIDDYVNKGNVYNDEMADALVDILADDDQAKKLFSQKLYEKSKATAGTRLGAEGTLNKIDEADRELREMSEGSSWFGKAMLAESRQQLIGQRAFSSVAEPAAKGVYQGLKRSLESSLQYVKDTGDDQMNPFEQDELIKKFEVQGMSSVDAAREVGNIIYERGKRKERRLAMAALMKSALEQGEDEGLKGRPFLERAGYKTGNTFGTSAPMYLPTGVGQAAGFMMMYADRAQQARMEGALLGLDPEEREKRAVFRGLTGAAVEKIAFGKMGKMVPGFGKALAWAQAGKPATMRAWFASSPKIQAAAHTVMGMAEEAVLEPTAEFVMNSAADLFLKDERGKATFAGYVNELQSYLEPDQFAALAVFSAGMSSVHYSALKQGSREFQDRLQQYQAAGGTEAGFIQAMDAPTDASRAEVLLENLHQEWITHPQEAAARAEKAGKELLSGERIQSLRELDSWQAAQDAGLLPRVEASEVSGKMRVYQPGETESFTLMDRADAEAYLRLAVDADTERAIVRAQQTLAGDVAVRSALDQGRIDAAEVMTRDVVDEKTGETTRMIAPESLEQMKARADMAMAAIRSLEAEGISPEEARQRIDPALSESIPLGAVAELGAQAEQRIATERARNPEFNAERAASAAYVTSFRQGDSFQRVLRYARGEATAEDLMEETMEQALISWQAENDLTWKELGASLQDAQRAVNQLFPEARGKEAQFIHLDEGRAVTRTDAVEAFSKMGRAKWLHAALNNKNLPQWLRKLLNHLVNFLGAFNARVELGDMIRQAEEQGVLTLPVRQALAVMMDAGDALYRGKSDSLIQETMDRAQRQAQLDAELGRGVAMERETLEEELEQRNAPEEQDYTPRPRSEEQEELDRLAQDDAVVSPVHEEEQAIRDGAASLAEAASYIRKNHFTEADAAQRGLTENQTTLKGVEIGLYGSPAVLNALKNGRISEDDAWRLSMAVKNNPAAQRAGLGQLLQGNDFTQAYDAMMEAARKAEEEGTTFSLSDGEESLEEVTASWNRLLEDYQEGKIADKTMPLRVGPTPAVLRMLGAHAYDLTITGAVLDKVTKEKHSVPMDELQRLPEALTRPLAVFESVTQAESMVVLTELKEGNNNVVAAVHLNTTGENRVYINRIASLYGKDNPHALINQPLLYLDNKKARAWLATVRLQLPAAASFHARDKRKVMYPRDLVNWKNEKNLSSTTFSIIGEKADTFQEYVNNGLTYLDPADGKRKAIIDSRGVRLKKERPSVSEGGHVNVSLAAALDFPELFRAYPELKKLRVDFYRDGKSNAGGFSNRKDNYIAVNMGRGARTADPAETLDTILHEVQHQIQAHEGFAGGSNVQTKDQALQYLNDSLDQLTRRRDAWAVQARPRLKAMIRGVKKETLRPEDVYFLSHGEQEARLAARAGENSVGVSMSGLNGFKQMNAPWSTIPLTGDINELGGITFAGGRFDKLTSALLAPNGNWLYDETVFKMRAAVARAARKLSLYQDGGPESALERMAEVESLLSTVERMLPHSYGFGLEPYKIWSHVFSLLMSSGTNRSSRGALTAAMEALPMKGWPDVMRTSISKTFAQWVEDHPEERDQRDGLMRNGMEGEEALANMFDEHGEEFLRSYGNDRLLRLAGKFLERVAGQIDRYRKDVLLGRIRRVAASVSPKKDVHGKPMKGKMSIDAYRKLESYLRLLDMTEAQYDAFFDNNYPLTTDQDTGEELDPWDKVAPDAVVRLELPDESGKPAEVAVTKTAFETYACFERMTVDQAECCARALGELTATSRDAWDNAARQKRDELAFRLQPLFQAAGRMDAVEKARIRSEWSNWNPSSYIGGLLDSFLNGAQFLDSLQRVKPLAPLARSLRDKLANAEANIVAWEKKTLDATYNAAAMATGLKGQYALADWMADARKKKDSGLVLTEQEPDWKGQAFQQYRSGVMSLIRRKIAKHGADKVMAQAEILFRMDDELREELRRLWPVSSNAKPFNAQGKQKSSVFTENELQRYADQQDFITEHARSARGRSEWGKGKTPSTMPLDALSPMEAAYIVLLADQADYADALRIQGFTDDMVNSLRDFAGKDVMAFAYRLRDELNKRSHDIQTVMERKTGAPFPLVDNYFRAFFDIGIQQEEKNIGEASAYGEAAGSGSFGMLHARKKHRLNLDFNMDVVTAFSAAMTEQTYFLHMSEVSNDLRAILSYRSQDGKKAAAALEKLLGADGLNKLNAWANRLDNAGADAIRGQMAGNRIVNAISSGAVRAFLPGRLGTHIKQWTGLINTLFSSDDFSLSDWASSIARLASGKLVMSPKQIRQLPEIAGRFKGRSAFAQAAGGGAVRKRSSRAGALGRWFMERLEKDDMLANSLSCSVLYDSAFRKARREAPNAGDAAWHAAARLEIRRSLSSKGQPMTISQKSLLAQTRTMMTVGNFFLGGESINTFAKCLNEFRKASWKSFGRGSSIWIAHGLLVALADALLHIATDDEERRRKRSLWDLLYYTLTGPVSGIPILSGAVASMFEKVGQAAGLHVYSPKDSSVIPFANFNDIFKAFKKIDRVFDSKQKKDWQDYPLAFADALRAAAVGSIAFNAQQSKAKAAAAGLALTAAAIINGLEVFLKAWKAEDQLTVPQRFYVEDPTPKSTKKSSPLSVL